MIFALAAFTTAFAQENKNEKKETVVTKTTVTDSKGKDVATKAVSRTEKQVVSLDNSDANMTNQDVVMTPTKVSTDVTYSNDGNNYVFQNDKEGYKMMYANADSVKDYAIIRPSTQRGYYIMSQDGNSSFGYFNQNGDFVVESYDPGTDSIISTVYQLQVKEKKVMKKDKM